MVKTPLKRTRKIKTFAAKRKLKLNKKVRDSVASRPTKYVIMLNDNI